MWQGRQQNTGVSVGSFGHYGTILETAWWHWQCAYPLRNWPVLDRHTKKLPCGAGPAPPPPRAVCLTKCSWLSVLLPLALPWNSQRLCFWMRQGCRAHLRGTLQITVPATTSTWDTHENSCGNTEKFNLPMNNWGVSPTERSQFPQLVIELVSSTDERKWRAKLMDHRSCSVAFLLMLHARIHQQLKPTRVVEQVKDSLLFQFLLSPQWAAGGDRLSLMKRWIKTHSHWPWVVWKLWGARRWGLRDSAQELNPCLFAFKIDTVPWQGESPNDFIFHFS